MVIQYSGGKIIVTPFEIVVKENSTSMVTMQASSDAVTLIGNGANVITANTGEVKWSIKLDSQHQLQEVAQQIGCEIR
ncbi:DUF3389 domain-containing protein [Vibrio sp. S4M6]|uniref:DUF3389 domain-containing protein n=1 Tax=Vibrio sinus TaxID=2946865 RepID=UPI00202A3FA4|nr:DUF3389 domain-containing protein [Vibrio sinus]